jgi:hypothetical protein
MKHSNPPSRILWEAINAVGSQSIEPSGIVPFFRGLHGPSPDLSKVKDRSPECGRPD